MIVLELDQPDGAGLVVFGVFLVGSAVHDCRDTASSGGGDGVLCGRE